MVDFNTLKKSGGSLERLSKEIEKIYAPQTEKLGDPRFWQPEVDKAGNGMAIIRFLPTSPADGDDSLPWVRIFNHGFKGPTGKWYIENSLTTLGKKDPVSEYNSQLWNASTDDNSVERKQARAQKRRLNYISNIYVITDSKNPENEGKVFLYRYGKKIFDKISEAMNPPFDDAGRSQDDPKYDPTNAFSPFDLWTGATFRLKIRNVDGYRNYDSSTFDSSGPLFNDDAKLEEIWKQEYSLKEFLQPENFKSYEELKAKLDEVLELGATKRPTMVDKPVSRTAAMVEEDSVPFDVDEEDDDLKSFRALAS